MKYKIVGIIDILIGLLQIIVPVTMLFTAIPALQALYAEYNTEGSSVTLAYSMIFFIIFLGLINIFLAVKLLSPKTENREKYFTYGIISAIGTFILMGVSSTFLLLSIFLPLFNLVSEVK